MSNENRLFRIDFWHKCQFSIFIYSLCNLEIRVISFRASHYLDFCLLIQTFWIQKKINDVHKQDAVVIVISRCHVSGYHNLLE